MLIMIRIEVIMIAENMLVMEKLAKIKILLFTLIWAAVSLSSSSSSSPSAVFICAEDSCELQGRNQLCDW